LCAGRHTREKAQDRVLRIFSTGDQLTASSLKTVWSWPTTKDRSEADRVREEILAVVADQE
jgi:hypothetical protein